MADPPGGGASKAASRGTGVYQRLGLQLAARRHQRFAGDALHPRLRNRRQSLPRLQRSVARHRAGQEGIPQLLHPRLQHHQRQEGWQVSQDHRQAEQQHRRPSWNSATAISPKRFGASSTAPTKSSSCSRRSRRRRSADRLPLALEVDYFRISPDGVFRSGLGEESRVR